MIIFDNIQVKITVMYVTRHFLVAGILNVITVFTQERNLMLAVDVKRNSLSVGF
jgi:hypothetical protein